MKIEEIATSVVNELTIAYMQAGSHISADNALSVAKSLCESIDFNGVEEVKASFRRAKMVTDIPTQRTLAEALRNHRAESTPVAFAAPQLEHRNPREPWLPSDTLGKRINLCTAIKNYCAAVSDALYMEYCKVHTHHKDGTGRWVFDSPDRVETFEAPIKETLKKLYRKYWRRCSCAAGYPEGAPYNLGLAAPTVQEFRAMLAHESHA